MESRNITECALISSPCDCGHLEYRCSKVSLLEPCFSNPITESAAVLLHFSLSIQARLYVIDLMLLKIFLHITRFHDKTKNKQCIWSLILSMGNKSPLLPHIAMSNTCSGTYLGAAIQNIPFCALFLVFYGLPRYVISSYVNVFMWHGLRSHI